jgi:hypothetical protein
MMDEMGKILFGAKIILQYNTIHNAAWPQPKITSPLSPPSQGRDEGEVKDLQKKEVFTE